jgi:immunity protein, SdpI family
MNRRPMILFSAGVIAAMLVVSAWAFTQLPAGAPVPVHWGIDGQIDGYAPKEVGLFFLPVLTAVLAGILAVIPRYEPRRANLERSSKAYGAIWTAAIVLFGALHVLFIAAALGTVFDVTRPVLIGIGALLVVVGNYLPKVRPNYIMGIRTPWTLASDLSWARTHRIGGRLFVVEGLLILALGILGVRDVLVVVAVLGSAVVGLVVVFVYSYRVWKLDPEKRPA